jgi:hypothetical protein
VGAEPESGDTIVRLFPVLLVLAWFAPPALSAETAAGPSVGHPLAPLCDRICGGSWGRDHPPAPDEEITTMRFAWDPETRTIRGEAVTAGGIAGRQKLVAIVFDVDPAADAVTVARTSEGGASVTGVVAVTTDGFQTRFAAPGSTGESLTNTVRFQGADVWIERSEILSQGVSTLTTETRYRRAPE